eukprot:3872289-Prymnesium_polylepis.2
MASGLTMTCCGMPHTPRAEAEEVCAARDLLLVALEPVAGVVDADAHMRRACGLALLRLADDELDAEGAEKYPLGRDLAALTNNLEARAGRAVKRREDGHAVHATIAGEAGDATTGLLERGERAARAAVALGPRRVLHGRVAGDGAGYREDVDLVGWHDLGDLFEEGVDARVVRDLDLGKTRIGVAAEHLMPTGA